MPSWPSCSTATTIEYYVLAQPAVSDQEYDRLFDELVRLEREHPDLRQPDSPTARVGSDLSLELPEVAHTVPVLSLDKAYTAADVQAWMEKTSAAADQPQSFTVEEKIDGSAIVLYYEAGRLARADYPRQRCRGQRRHRKCAHYPFRAATSAGTGRGRRARGNIPAPDRVCPAQHGLGG